MEKTKKNDLESNLENEQINNLENDDKSENQINEVPDSNENVENKNESDEMLNSKKKITELENELNDYKDRLIRKIAEFDNYKRRTENDQLNLLKYAAENFIVNLLQVIDDFERSLKHSSDVKDIKSVVEGLQMIYDKFIKLLNDQGVKKIDAVGVPFDVHYHEALLQRPAEGVTPFTVLEEVETGYIYKDKVIRHSKVIVSDESNLASPEDEKNIEEGNE